MADRSHRNAEYVIIRDSKPKKPTHYFYDADDDNESQAGATTRRVVRAQPSKEQRIRYVIADEHESDYRRQRVVEPSDVRTLNNDEDENGKRSVVVFSLFSVDLKYGIQRAVNKSFLMRIIMC